MPGEIGEKINKKAGKLIDFFENVVYNNVYNKIGDKLEKGSGPVMQKYGRNAAKKKERKSDDEKEKDFKN